MDGSNQTRLTNSTYDDTTPVFSPDGQKIAFFSNRSGSYKIYTMSWNGTGIQPVTNSECSTGSWNAGRGLAWSPDGQKLLFKPTSSSLATINLDGTAKDIVWDGAINGHDLIQGVEWGPTADDIYVNAQDWGWGYDQHVFRKSGNAWTQITNDAPDSPSMSSHVSSQISRIVFHRQEGYIGGYNVYTMGLNGEDVVALTFDTGGTWTCNPDWLDNGNGIVFSSNRTGSHQIWLMDSTGANQQMLQGEGSNFAPSWTSIPEPATLLLFGLGGLSLLKKRK
jgi:TolB protein